MGTDKRKCPAAIEKFAARTGARIISPGEDMGIREKTELTKSYSFANEHEKDAIAAALLAYNELRPLLEKIRKAASAQLRESVTKTVVTKGISISAALEDMKPKPAPETAQQKKPFTPVPRQINPLAKTVEIMRRHNNKLIKALNRHKATIRKLRAMRKTSPDHRERTIQALAGQARAKNEQINLLSEEIALLQQMLAMANSKAIVKKLKDLTWQEYAAKNRILKIGEGDILLVENPEKCSERTISELKDKALIILCRGKPGSQLYDSATLIDASEISLTENEHFAIGDRTEIEAEKSKKDLLGRIVTSYRKERQGTT